MLTCDSGGGVCDASPVGAFTASVLVGVGVLLLPPALFFTSSKSFTTSGLVSDGSSAALGSALSARMKWALASSFLLRPMLYTVPSAMWILPSSSGEQPVPHLVTASLSFFSALGNSALR